MSAFRSAGRTPHRHGDLLPPDGVRRATMRQQAREIIDVEFETVALQSRRSAYPVFNDNRPRSVPAATSARAIRSEKAFSVLFKMLGWLLVQLERRLRQVSARVFAGAVAVVCLAVFSLVFAGNGVASGDAAPMPLTLEHVTTAISDANGMKVISVFGAIENPSLTAQTVPTVTVDLFDNGRRTASMAVAALDEPLQPGETRPFTVRLPHAGGKVPGVRLSFASTGAQRD